MSTFVTLVALNGFLSVSAFRAVSGDVSNLLAVVTFLLSLLLLTVLSHMSALLAVVAFWS
jgi:hypothetical protein